MHFDPSFAYQMHLTAPDLGRQTVNAAQRTYLECFGAHGKVSKEGSKPISHDLVRFAKLSVFNGNSSTA